MIDLIGNEVEIKNCLGCEIVSGQIDVFGGILFQSEHFVIAQDFELPIEGFFIITSKRHIKKFVELSTDEQMELMQIINKSLKILEENEVAEEYNIILEEKESVHFHVWLMPRHKWMIEKFGKVLKNIKPIQDYAIQNMKTEENFDRIKSICNLLKRELNKEWQKEFLGIWTGDKK